MAWERAACEGLTAPFMRFLDLGERIKAPVSVVGLAVAVQFRGRRTARASGSPAAFENHLGDYFCSVSR